MLSEMKMGTKILAGFGVALAILLVVGGVAWSGASSLQAALRDVAEEKFPSAEALAHINEAQTAVARANNVSLLRRADAEMRRANREYLKAAWARMDGGLQDYEALPHGAEALRLYGEVKPLLAEWRRKAEQMAQIAERRDRLLEAGRAADDEAVKAVDQEMWAAFLAQRSAFGPAEAKLGELMARTAADAKAAKEAGLAAGARAVTTTLAGLAVGAALLVLLGAVLGRRIGATVRALVGEAGKLREAVAAGQLGVRGDVAAVEGEFRPIVQGINETMDAFQKPIQVTADYVTRISNGDIPPRITDRYEGEFNAIKDALNRCVDSISGLVGEMNRMSAEHEKGDIDVVVDAARFQGAYAAMARGVNEMVGVLDDNYTSPPATTTPPHPEARRNVAPPTPRNVGGWRGESDGRAGEEADGGDVEAREGRRGGHARRPGPQDGPEVRGGGEAAVRAVRAEDLADAA